MRVSIKNYPIVGATLPKPGQPESSNADCYASSVRDCALPTIILVVCDGLSSCKNGSGAARYTRQSITECFDTEWNEGIDAREWLSRTLVNSHHSVRDKYPNNDAHCTVVVALIEIAHHRITLAFAGDSPAYLGHDGTLEKLTTDHLESVVKRAQSVTTIKRALTNYVGKRGEFEPQIAQLPYKDGDLLFLTSDGIVPAEIQSLLRSANTTMKDADVAKACEKSGRISDDDATMLVVRLGLPQSSASLSVDLARYAMHDPAKRSALLLQAKQEKQEKLLDAMVLRECFRIEGDEGLALGIFDLLARDPNGMTKLEWIGILDLAIERRHQATVVKLKHLIRTL